MKKKDEIDFIIAVSGAFGTSHIEIGTHCETAAILACVEAQHMHFMPAREASLPISVSPERKTLEQVKEENVWKIKNYRVDTSDRQTPEQKKAAKAIADGLRKHKDTCMKNKMKRKNKK